MINTSEPFVSPLTFRETELKHVDTGRPLRMCTRMCVWTSVVRSPVFVLCVLE